MQRTTLACVIGDMDLVRPLGLAGIPCAVVAKPGDPIRYSRHTRDVLEWADPWLEAEVLIERLVEWGRRQERKPILFYEEDRDLLLISRNRERLAEAFHFVVPERELVEDLVDKARFTGLAERLALPVPQTRRLRSGSLADAAVEELRFPLIVKPLTRRTACWVPLAGGNKALRVDDAAQWSALREKLHSAELDVLIQELIEGPETRIESYHAYVTAEGEIAGEFTGRKIRTHPREYGYSTALEITESADVAELGREHVRRLRFTGVAKFDFKRAADGRLYLLEVNPRFNLWHHPAAVAGMNLPALVYADLAGVPRPAAERARAGVRWSYVWYDALAAREWGVSPLEWLRWTVACEAKSAFSLDDPLPFLRGVLWRKVARRLTGASRQPELMPEKLPA